HDGAVGRRTRHAEAPQFPLPATTLSTPAPPAAEPPAAEPPAAEPPAAEPPAVSPPAASAARSSSSAAGSSRLSNGARTRPPGCPSTFIAALTCAVGEANLAL